MKNILLILYLMLSGFLYSQNSRQPNFKKMKGTSIAVNHIIPFEKQAFCYYFENEISQFNDVDIDKIFKSLDKSEASTSYFPHHKYNYTVDNKNLVFLKYEINQVIDSIVTTTLETSVFQLNEKEVLPYDYTNDRISSLIYSVVKISKTNLLIQFFKEKNNPEYAVINDLKPQIKLANGVVDIEKLAETIIANTDSLGEYLE